MHFNYTEDSVAFAAISFKSYNDDRVAAFEKIVEILLEHGANVNTPDDGGYPALSKLAAEGKS